MAQILVLLLAATLQSEELQERRITELPISLSGEVLRIASQAGPPPREEALVLNVAGHVKFTMPFGAADRSTIVYGPGVVVVDSYTSWTDFFHPGWGLDLEIDVFFANKGPGPNREPGFNYGVMVLLGADEFGGDTVHGVAGTSISV